MVGAIVPGSGYDCAGFGKYQRKKVCCVMRRMILVLMVTAMMLATLVVSAGSPAFAQDVPSAPQCGWYYNMAANYDPWWEYWCWWPGWGWEFVFWVYD